MKAAPAAESVVMAAHGFADTSGLVSWESSIIYG
jgi:hypothetical protein